jgi:MarR family transcriptional regulator, 2-MHQ and catechol-resistance regulon repressor
MSEAKPDGYWNHQVWLLLHYAHDLVIKIEEDTFRRKAGVSYQQFLILMVMESFEGPATGVELAHLLQRNANTVSMILDRMEKIDLVKKVRSKTDRRLVHVRMTPTGKEKLAQAIKVGNSLVDSTVTGFSEEELKEFARLLQKLSSQAAREAGMKMNPVEAAAANIKRAENIFKPSKS